MSNIRLLFFRLRGSKTSVGKGFLCSPYVYLSSRHSVKAGDNVFFGRFVHIASNIDIGNDVMIAAQASFVGGDHRIDQIGDLTMRFSGVQSDLTTVIEDNVWIGHKAIIMAGVRIKQGAVVAAGAIVTKDVDENAIVAGPYAREIRKRKL